jgi:hypothetical protein
MLATPAIPTGHAFAMGPGAWSLAPVTGRAPTAHTGDPSLVRPVAAAEGSTIVWTGGAVRSPRPEGGERRTTTER